MEKWKKIKIRSIGRYKRDLTHVVLCTCIIEMQLEVRLCEIRNMKKKHKEKNAKDGFSTALKFFFGFSYVCRLQLTFCCFF